MAPWTEPDVRRDVILAALFLTYVQETCLGRVTADESATLDHAQDRMDDALTAYVAVVQPTPAATGDAGTTRH